MQFGWLNPVNSLAGRIFIWFWLVLMLTVALTLLLSRQLIEDTDIRRLPPSITAQLQQQVLQWQQLPPHVRATWQVGLIKSGRF